MTALKIDGLYWHAKKRAVDRYGVAPSREAMLGLELSIVNGGSMLLHKVGDSELHLVEFKAVKMAAVYLPDRLRIVTFLPPETIRDAKKRKLFFQAECGEEDTSWYPDKKEKLHTKLRKGGKPRHTAVPYRRGSKPRPQDLMLGDD